MNRLDMLECWGGLLFGRYMEHDWVKIPMMADELGVTAKTIYNWLSVGKLVMPRPGYVNRMDAYEVWLEQKNLRKIHSHFMAVQGTNRDANGQFKSKKESVEESGE